MKYLGGNRRIFFPRRTQYNVRTRSNVDAGVQDHTNAETWTHVSQDEDLERGESSLALTAAPEDHPWTSDESAGDVDVEKTLTPRTSCDSDWTDVTERAESNSETDAHGLEQERKDANEDWLCGPRWYHCVGSVFSV